MASLTPITDVKIQYTQLFINNEFVDSKSGKKFKTINPVNGQVLAEVSEAFKEDVDVAVEAAYKAFQSNSSWRKLSASQRGRLLYKLAELLEKNIQYAASLETLDNGKPFTLAVSDVQSVVDLIRYYAGWADKINGRTMSTDGKNFSYTLVEPVGVVALILPWNFPLLVTMLKWAAAVAVGCTAVIKPAEQTPLTTLWIASLVKEAGFPPGVFNVLPGYGPTAGEPIVLHPKVDKISFTGSSEIGRHIQSISAKTNLKRVTLELGGKSPFVIMDDADIDKAVEQAHFAVFFNQGQVCCAGSRTFVHEKIYDEFVRKSVARAQRRKLGDPYDVTTEQGPQVDADQFTKILELIDSGVKEGAQLETGGKAWSKNNGGYYIEPTVFSNVQDSFRIAKEEIFGPCQQILKFSTLEEAIKRSNDTEYGLAAGIMTNNLESALLFAREVKAGSVWVNNYMAGGVQLPFGGFKVSGHGREGGSEGLNPFCEIKAVVIDLPAPSS